MTSLYHATVPGFLQVLPAVAALVDKARDHCAAKGEPEESLTGAKLAADMWPFGKQVTASCLHSAGAIAGVLAGETGPDLNPPETRIAMLSSRVAEAIAALKAVDPEAINAIAANDMCFRFGERRMEFTVEDYLLSFAVPNFYFHASMAYAVLRNQGLPVGKADFMGRPRMK